MEPMVIKYNCITKNSSNNIKVIVNIYTEKNLSQSPKLSELRASINWRKMITDYEIFFRY